MFRLSGGCEYSRIASCYAFKFYCRYGLLAQRFASLAYKMHILRIERISVVSFMFNVDFYLPVFFASSICQYNKEGKFIPSRRIKRRHLKGRETIYRQKNKISFYLSLCWAWKEWMQLRNDVNWWLWELHACDRSVWKWASKYVMTHETFRSLVISVRKLENDLRRRAKIFAQANFYKLLAISPWKLIEDKEVLLKIRERSTSTRLKELSPDSELFSFIFQLCFP